MKRDVLYLLSAFILLPAIFNTAPCIAEHRVAERLYVATDRGTYISGEAMWLSVYCFDISDGSPLLSGLSNVVYVELHNSQGAAHTCKIALNKGRGSGRLVLPPTLPTGNYRLVAYTRQMLNEETPVYFQKIVSIFNTLTSERVEGNVKFEGEVHGADSVNAVYAKAVNTGDNDAVTIRFNENPGAVSRNGKFPLAVVNNGKESITMNISVVKIDSIPAPRSRDISATISEYLTNGRNRIFVDKYTPEFEGEIIKGKVTCEGKDLLSGRLVFLSAANGLSDIYSSMVDEKGNLTFYTNSIFGDREIILEIPKADTNSNITFEISDPFVRPNTGAVPSLTISRRFEQSLRERSIEMQLGRRFESDTLFQRFYIMNDPLLDVKPIVYQLDEYTRFPYMKDVVLEFVSDLRFREVGGKTDLQVRWEDLFNSKIYSENNSLILIDGIPVFDHQRVMDYDPLKVKSISVYTKEFIIGAASFSGIASFRTYKGDYPGLTFNRNVRIMDYKGVLYPCRFTGKELKERSTLPDLRSTLYFDPQIDIAKGGSEEITVYTPSYPGSFQINVEGIDKNGTPFSVKKSFEVN